MTWASGSGSPASPPSRYRYTGGAVAHESVDEWTLIVTAIGVAVAAVAFLANQGHAILARRRDFLTAVLEAVHLSFSGVLGDIDNPEANKARARAAAMAELGLGGRVQEKALRFLHRLGPYDAPVGGGEPPMQREEQLDRIRDAYNEFVPELWRAAHPFRSLFGIRGRPVSLPPPDGIYHSTGTSA